MIGRHDRVRKMIGNNYNIHKNETMFPDPPAPHNLRCHIGKPIFASISDAIPFPGLFFGTWKNDENYYKMMKIKSTVFYSN